MGDEGTISQSTLQVRPLREMVLEAYPGREPARIRILPRKRTMFFDARQTWPGNRVRRRGESSKRRNRLEETEVLRGSRREALRNSQEDLE